VDCTPEMRRIELQPGDSAVVLATDGLWDVITDSQAVSILAKVTSCACTGLCRGAPCAGDTKPQCG
jgi:serine/threonine protein phosphatase PrpC